MTELSNFILELTKRGIEIPQDLVASTPQMQKQILKNLIEKTSIWVEEPYEILSETPSFELMTLLVYVGSYLRIYGHEELDKEYRESCKDCPELLECFDLVTQLSVKYLLKFLVEMTKTKQFRNVRSGEIPKKLERKSKKKTSEQTLETFPEI